MKVKLLTDAPRHNLALMKISAYHKAKGDEVWLGTPQEPCDLSYGSWLFRQSYETDKVGGPAVDPQIKLPREIDEQYPDYSLYPDLGYSVGATWLYCPRSCGFCVVPKQNNPQIHRSIYEFLHPDHKRISILNNNWLSDPQWLDTFEEIWREHLTVIDNGFDLRLLDDEKVSAIKRTRFDGLIHWAWDCIEDKEQIVKGLTLLKENGMRGRSMVYVLTGYNTTLEQDIERCDILNKMGFDPFVMVYNNKANPPYLRQFRRMINRTRAYRGYKSIGEAWANYE